MTLVRRHRAPGPRPGIDARALIGLQEENFSLWPHRRRAGIIERARFAAALREGDGSVYRSENPTSGEVAGVLA